tara:strand:- start:2667 stop:2888 length:222 start_codon:yes stop_codon:yes gene_type:complete
MEDINLIEYASNIQYLVIDEYQNAYTFCSLREIGKNIEINYSTISKKMTNNKKCLLTSKKTGITYYICNITLN